MMEGIACMTVLMYKEKVCHNFLFSVEVAFVSYMCQEAVGTSPTSSLYWWY